MKKQVFQFQVLLIVTLMSYGIQTNSIGIVDNQSQSDNEERLEFVSSKDTLVGNLPEDVSITIWLQLTVF